MEPSLPAVPTEAGDEAPAAHGGAPLLQAQVFCANADLHMWSNWLDEGCTAKGETSDPPSSGLLLPP